MSTANATNHIVTQYNVITGDANNLLNNVAPGIAGTVLTSNGAAAQPTYQAVSGDGSMARTFMLMGG